MDKFVITLINTTNKVKVAIDGVPQKTLRMQRFRTYYFDVQFPPNISLDFANYKIAAGTTAKIMFDEHAPNQFIYMINNNPGGGGVIELEGAGK